MLTYILRRLLVLPIVMFLVTAILFFLLLQLPAERRAEIYLPAFNTNRVTEEEYARLVQVTIERYGLDKPFYIQYSNWIRNLFQGDWGFSPSWRQPVLEGLLHRLPASIELGVFAMIPSVLFALILGGIAAIKQNHLPDYMVRLSAFVSWAIPNYIFGLLFMTIFYGWLDWFPPERLGYAANAIVNSETFKSFTGFLIIDGILNRTPDITWEAIRHLMLPGITLAVFQWALFVRIMRSSLLEEFMQDYVTTARAKGLKENNILRVHIYRNALLPVIASAGVATATLFGNLIIVEVLFSFNGVGRWAIQAIQNFDAPAAIGFILLSSVVSLLASLGADILFAIVDPRVSIE